MSARELEVAARFRADSTLMAILLGKVWSYSQLGTEGITSPVTTPAAYASGLLKPCCVVKENATLPSNHIRDQAAKVADTSTRLECWLYQYIESGAITAARLRIYQLLEGERLNGTAPLTWIFELAITPEPTMAKVMMAHTDFQIVALRKAVVA